MLTKTLQGMKKKEQTKLLKRLASDVGGVDPTRNSPNPALISERSKQISYIRSMVDTWNPAQLNDALKQLDLPIIDSWNPQIIEEQRLRLTSYLIERTASGETVSIKAPGNLTLTILGVKADITPIQDLSHGDPSPTNICPIYGHTQEVISNVGVNQWDEVAEKGTINDTTGQNANDGLNQYTRSKNYIPVFEGETYCFKVASSGKVYYYDAEKTYMSYSGISNGAIKTIPSGCAYIRFWVNYSGAYNNDMSVNYPSTNTEYNAYNGETHTIDLNGTRYGGTLDVTEGVLTVGKAEVDLGTLTWNYNSQYSVFYARIVGKKEGRTNILSEMYKVVNKTYQDMVDGEVAGVTGAQQSDYINIKDLRYNNISDFTNGVTGSKLCYELATPTTVTLTPTQITALLGENNLSASTGNIEVKYKFNF